MWSSCTRYAGPGDGNLVLFVVPDHGSLRSYRVDRIIGVRPTTRRFTAGFVSTSVADRLIYGLTINFN